MDGQSDESDSTYTLGLMTCHILPGVQAREYVVRSSSRALGFMDLLIWMTILCFVQVKPSKDVGIDAIILIVCSYNILNMQALLR